MANFRLEKTKLEPNAESVFDTLDIQVEKILEKQSKDGGWTIDETFCAYSSIPAHIVHKRLGCLLQKTLPREEETRVFSSLLATKWLVRFGHWQYPEDEELEKDKNKKEEKIIFPPKVIIPDDYPPKPDWLKKAEKLIEDHIQKNNIPNSWLKLADDLVELSLHRIKKDEIICGVCSTQYKLADHFECPVCELKGVESNE